MYAVRAAVSYLCVSSGRNDDVGVEKKGFSKAAAASCMAVVRREGGLQCHARG